VSGNGTYALSGLASGGAVNGQGASLVVVYSNPLLSTRTVILMDGNDVVRFTTFISNTISGFTAPARVNARTTFIVGGGQGAADSTSFAGSLAPLSWTNNFSGGDGNYWDTDTFSVSSTIGPGDTSATASMTFAGDWLMWVAQVFSVGPPGVIITPTGGSTDVTE